MSAQVKDGSVLKPHKHRPCGVKLSKYTQPADAIDPVVADEFRRDNAQSIAVWHRCRDGDTWKLFQSFEGRDFLDTWKQCSSWMRIWHVAGQLMIVTGQFNPNTDKE